MNIFLYPFPPEDWVSRNGFRRSVPRQPPTHSPHSGYSRDSSPPIPITVPIYCTPVTLLLFLNKYKVLHCTVLNCTDCRLGLREENWSAARVTYIIVEYQRAEAVRTEAKTVRGDQPLKRSSAKSSPFHIDSARSLQVLRYCNWVHRTTRR